MYGYFSASLNQCLSKGQLYICVNRAKIPWLAWTSSLIKISLNTHPNAPAGSWPPDHPSKYYTYTHRGHRCTHPHGELRPVLFARAATQPEQLLVRVLEVLTPQEVPGSGCAKTRDAWSKSWAYERNWTFRIKVWRSDHGVSKNSFLDRLVFVCLTWILLWRSLANFSVMRTLLKVELGSYAPFTPGEFVRKGMNSPSAARINS